MITSKLITVHDVSADELASLIRDAVNAALAGLVVKPLQEPEPKYLTGQEVDKMFHVTPMTRSNWVNKGFLKKYKVGRRVLFRADEVEAALNNVEPLKYRRK